MAPSLLKEINPVVRSPCVVDAEFTSVTPVTGFLYLSELSALSIPVTIAPFNPQFVWGIALGIAFLQLSFHCYISLSFLFESFL